MKFFRSFKILRRKKWVRFEAGRPVRYRAQNWPMAITVLICFLSVGLAASRSSSVNKPEGSKPSGRLGANGLSRIKDALGSKPTLPPVSSDGTPVTNSNNSKVSLAHKNILTTYFWVGEQSGPDNGFIPNAASTWDEQWQTHYGGVDDPVHRNNYQPAAFTPKENPFYFALPYSDIDSNGKRKPSATSCPNAAPHSTYSWCKNSWVAISHGGKIAYAQWEDAGPFSEDDIDYVFGTAEPKNKQGAKAGLDVSPAVKDYLGLSDVDRCDWGFVDASNVPEGPWKNVLTTTPGVSAN